jgi:uncharacterized protein (DUF1015 family)
VELRPFRAVRPAPPLAGRIPSVPYDVVDTAEARALAAGNPDSFLRVVRPEIQFDQDLPPGDPRAYGAAREALDAMRASGAMVSDPRPALYVYRLVREGRAQTGVVGVAPVADYEEGRIRRHELTRAEKELDRVRHTRALGAHPGLLFLAARPDARWRLALAAIADTAPVADFVAEDGVRHVVWRVDDAPGLERLRAVLRPIEPTYIADGHHRAAAYARVAREVEPPGEAGITVAVFPSDELTLLEYNRLVRDLAGKHPGAFLAAVAGAGFTVTPLPAAARPDRPRTFGMYVDGRWFRLEAPPAAPGEDPVQSLDVSVLATRLLGPVLRVGDPRSDPRIDFVGGGRGLLELARRVDAGDAAVAFALHPTRIEEVLAVADAGGVMPPKSTWFEPKLRSGLIVRVFEPRESDAAPDSADDSARLAEP